MRAAHTPQSLWAVIALSAALLEAIYRLGARAASVIFAGLSAQQWVWLLVIVALFVWAEGVRALHGRFVPGVLERLPVLSPFPLAIVLAPFEALGLLKAPAKTRLRALATVAAIVAAVLVVRQLPEPWRAMIDAGVAVALSVGVVSLLVRSLSQTRQSDAVPAPERPGRERLPEKVAPAVEPDPP